jgi:hypothetical protein
LTDEWGPVTVGRHWSIVVPVREADLSAEKQTLARERRDIRIP